MSSLNDFIIHPFLSLVVSFILFIGFFYIGKYIFYKINISIINKNLLYFQYNLIGILFIGIFLYPIGLIGYSSLLFFKLTAFLIFSMGVINLKKSFFSFKVYVKNLIENLENYDILFFRIIFVLRWRIRWRTIRSKRLKV